MLGSNPVTGLGVDGAVLRCLAPIQSLDWAWLGLLHVAWPQCSHWTGPGWGCSTLLGANPVIGVGLAEAAVPCSAPIQSLDWAWMGLYAAWHQSSHWAGPGWGCCTLLGANSVTGLGLDRVVLRCLAQIQSLDWAWMGLFCVAWRQSSHWTRRGWGCSTLPGANPIVGLGLDGAVLRCLAPLQSLDWAWMGLFYVARRQSSHWIWPGWGCSALLGANPVT